MHLDPSIILAGAIVGFAVGLTGVGGGALMTPVLVLLLHVQPSAAVSSDLVASLFMKPVGGAVHLRRKTVHLGMVGWLALGAVPAAFAGAAFLNLAVHGKALQKDIKIALGIALLLAVVGIVLRSVTAKRAAATEMRSLDHRVSVRRVPTLLVGIFGGFIVGMTSVGSGSLMIVALMFLYPALTGSELVGTDLVQSVPLVAAAALGQMLFGHVQLGLTVSLIIGSIPAVYLGARLSSVAPTELLRPAIAVLLLISALRLVNVGATGLGIAAAAATASFVAIAVVRRIRRTGADEVEVSPAHPSLNLAGALEDTA
ncbi:MAG TPA: sulfite exporter TauE/SafE family protein [Acidimicrobiales bacterium]|nr:sulfite exporter TauE/SafE family protein [Acidimicrobiales bacterium]